MAYGSCSCSCCCCCSALAVVAVIYLWHFHSSLIARKIDCFLCGNVSGIQKEKSTRKAGHGAGWHWLSTAAGMESIMLAKNAQNAICMWAWPGSAGTPHSGEVKRKCKRVVPSIFHSVSASSGCCIFCLGVGFTASLTSLAGASSKLICCLCRRGCLLRTVELCSIAIAS